MTWGPWHCKQVVPRWGPYSSLLWRETPGDMSCTGARRMGQFWECLVGVVVPRGLEGMVPPASSEVSA